MAKWVQKIVVNGRSAQITVPRELLFRLKVRPGDLMELEHEDDAESYSVRPWISRENRSWRGPGKLTPDPAVRS